MRHSSVAANHCAVSRRAAIFWTSAIPVNQDLPQKVSELVKINRFSHKIVDTGPESSFVNRLTAMRGENNYRSVLKAIDLADAANGFKSIKSWESQIH